MPEYRPLREGELILEGDKFSMVNGAPVDIAVTGVGSLQGGEETDGLQYYRLAENPTKTGNSLLNVLKNLIALGYDMSFPKWSQWEEIVLAQELIDGMSSNGYRTLREDEIIQLGDEVEKDDYKQRWISALSYRRRVKTAPIKMTPAIKAKLIEAIEAILYMGKDEGYDDWEFLNAVIYAKKLVAEQKKGK